MTEFRKFCFGSILGFVLHTSMLLLGLAETSADKSQPLFNMVLFGLTAVAFFGERQDG